MSASRPTSFINWNPSQSACAQPTDSLRARGYQPGEAPTAQNFNWLLNLSDQWINYLASSVSGAVMTSTLDTSTRLIGGGTLSYQAASGVFAWSQALYLSIPGVTDEDNTIAAGQVAVAPGQVIYVQANVPVSSPADVASGSAEIDNVFSTAGIVAGQFVTGDGIAEGTTVVSVGDTSVTLSELATASASQTLVTFAGTGPLTLKAENVEALEANMNTILCGRATPQGLGIGVNGSVMLLRDGEQKLLLEAGYNDVRYLVAGQALAARQVVHISTGQNGRTQGAVYPTDASQTFGATRSLSIGCVTAGVAQGATVSVMTGGVLAGFSGLTQGASYFVDPNNPGGLTLTRPSGANYVVPVGVALDASTLYVRISGNTAAPVLDPSYNSVVVQPVSGDATATALTLNDSAGASKLVVDASGNVTSQATFTTGPVVATSVSSAAGFKAPIGSGFVTQSISAGGSIGSQNQSIVNPPLLENGSGQVLSFKMPFAGSLVGISVSYRYTATQASGNPTSPNPVPTIYFYPQINGSNCKLLPNYNSNNYTGNVDYAFTSTQAKGVDTFRANDTFGILYSTTTFPTATTLYIRATLFVELAS